MSSRRQPILVNVGVAFAFIATICGFQGELSAQAVPPLVNYQGRLTDASGVPLPDGAYRVAVKLWNDPTATSISAPTHLIWGNEYAVTLIGGTFNVILGAGGGTPVPGAAVNDLNFAFGESNRFLGLTITQTPAGAIAPAQQREVLPRQQLLSVPFALQAQQAQVASSLITDLANALCPPGSIMAYMGTTPPPGWFLCDGAAVSRSQDLALFSVLGTNSGNGDGFTTFTLPDLRGRFLRGVDGTAGRDPDSGSRTNSSGVIIGNKVGSYQSDAFQSHNHKVYSTTSGTIVTGTRLVPDPLNNTVWNTSFVRADAITDLYAAEELSSARTSVETRPPNGYVNYIIKY